MRQPHISGFLDGFPGWLSMAHVVLKQLGPYHMAHRCQPTDNDGRHSVNRQGELNMTSAKVMRTMWAPLTHGPTYRSIKNYVKRTTDDVGRQ